MAKSCIQDLEKSHSKAIALLNEAKRQVEAEFAARKARVMAQEQAGQYDPDKAMDDIAKMLAEGYVEHR